MTSVLLVFLGGGLGSALRYGAGLAAVQLFGAAFPWGTLIVNVSGCFIMGLLARSLPLAEAGIADYRLLLMTGLLGGFTTFSAFSLDAAQLWMRHETGAALGYIAASVIASLAGVALGLWLGKAFA